MKLICDLCGGEIKLSADSKEGLCPECGMLYSGDALQEKLQQAGPAAEPVPEEPQRSEPAPASEGPVDIVWEEIPPRKPARPAGKPAAKPAKTKNKYKPMWITLIIIAMFAFWGTIFCPNGTEGIVFLLSLIALLVTLTIFRPWKG